MADQERTAQILLQILNDENTFSRTVAAVKDLGAHFDRTKGLVAELSEGYKQLAQSERDFNEAMRQQAEDWNIILAALEEENRAKTESNQLTKEQIALEHDLAAAMEASDKAIRAKAQAEREALQAQIDSAKESLSAFRDQQDLEASFGGGGGGGLGSQFAMGHALTAAGRTLGIPGLTEAGGFVYIEEGIRKVEPLMKNLGLTMGDLVGSILPVGVALAAVAIAFTAVTNEIKKAIEGLQAGVNQLEDFNKKASTLTTDEVKALMSGAQSDMDAAAATKARLGQDAAKLVGQINANGGMGNVVGNADKIAALKGITDQLDALQAKADSASAKLGEYTNLLDDNRVKLNDAAEATRKQAEDHLKQQAAFDADDKMATKALDEHKLALESQMDVLRENIAALEKSNETLPPLSKAHLENDAAIKKYKDTLDANATEVMHIILVSVGLAKARDDEAAAAKAFGDAIEAAEKQAKSFFSNIGKLVDEAESNSQKVADMRAKLADAIGNYLEKEQQAEYQYTQGSLQDSAQRRDIHTKEGREVAQIEEDTANKVADIHEKAGQKVAQIELDYARQVQDDRTKFFQNVAKDERTEREQEGQDALDHQRKLADIRKQDDSANVQALYDRNFLSIAKSKASHVDQENAENLSYSRREEDLKRHLAFQENEARISEQQQEEAQRVAEERKIADAQDAANREVAAAETAEKRKEALAREREKQELEDLTKHEDDKLAVMQRNAVIEITMMANQEYQREQLAAQTTGRIAQDAVKLFGAMDQAVGKLISPLLALSGGASSGGRGRTVYSRAGGGPGGPGDILSVNEPWSTGGESWSGAGRSIAFPGAGLFLPSGPGNVNPGGGKGGSSGQTNNFYITGDADSIAHKVLDILERQQ